MCVAIITRENVILARFRKRKSFGWAVYPGVGSHLPKWVHVAATNEGVSFNTASYSTFEKQFLQ